MRKSLAIALLLGLAAVPSAVQAQYPTQGYYYPQGNGYQNPQPYYPANPPPAYYYPQQMPRYVPTNGNYQGTPTYSPQPNPWYYAPARQDTHIILSPIPTTPPQPTPTYGATQNVNEPPVRQTGIKRKPAIAAETAQPDSGSAPAASAPVYLGAPVTGKSLPQNIEPRAPDILPSSHGHKKCKLMAFGDFLYWNVHGGDVPFAQAFDGIDPVFSVPRGPVGVVSPQFHTGIRAGGGINIDENFWVVGTFTYFSANTNAQIAAPDGQVLHNFLAFPNTTNSGVDSLTAVADYRIRLMMADLDFKSGIVDNERWMVNLVGGVRYAHLEQSLLDTFQLAGKTTVDSHVNFDGVGPRLGLETQCRTKCGIYGYATGMVDLLVGNFRGSTEERNIFTGLVGQTSITANRLVPILELEMGAGWKSSCGRLRFSGGYYIGSWSNTMTMTSLSSGIANTNFTTNGNNFRDNLIFNGLVTRFEFRY